VKRRWEYRIEAYRYPDGQYVITPSIAEYQDWLQGFGDEGWEVYAMIGGVVHMKRERSGLSEQEMKQNAKADALLVESLQNTMGWFSYLRGEESTHPIG